MKVRFLRDVIATRVSNICCFSGMSHREQLIFEEGEVVDAINVVAEGPRRKVKTRPGAPGGRVQSTSIQLNNENAGTTHPDYIEGVPSDAIEIVN